jgi:hypothetical protein
MSYVPYKAIDDRWYWRGPEGAYRDFDNDGNKDETVIDSGAFWSLPIYIGTENQVMIRKRKVFSKWRAGSRFHKKINHDDYIIDQITFAGPIYNRSWLHYLTDGCVTDGSYDADVVASGQGTSTITMTASTTIPLNRLAGLKGTFTGSTTEYTISSNTASSASAVQITLGSTSPADANGKTFTLSVHNHVWSNSATHVNPPKSFELLHVFTNDKSGGGESVMELHTGCMVISYNEKGSETEQICTGTYVVAVGNVVTVTSSTNATYEDFESDTFVRFADIGEFTWTKGTTALNGIFKGYELNFMTDKMLVKTSAFYPISTKAPNVVDPSLKITWMPHETDSWDDSQDDPTSALNKDSTLKISRNTSYDYFLIALDDFFQETEENPAWTNGNLYETYSFWLNPHEAATAFTLTEVNDLSATRYEN